MKPSKKKTAKRKSHSLVTKLLDLKYRINDWYRAGNKTSKADTRDDKSWVMNLIDDVRDNHLPTLCKEDMYLILVTGSRKVTPKMATAIKTSIGKCKMNPLYNEELREEADKKLQPILGKINVVKAMAESKDDYSVDFIKDVERYVRDKYRITKKQMEGLNKVYKRLTEDLFNEGDKDGKNGK